MVVETAVVMVTILSEFAGQSGISEEQASVVEVKVLKTVDVVIVTEGSIAVVGGTVGVSTVELKAMERLSELVGSTTVNEDSTLGIELANSLVEDRGVVSVLEAGIVDSAAEESSALVSADDWISDEDATAVDVISGVVEDGIGGEAGWQSNPTLSISTSQSSSLPY